VDVGRPFRFAAEDDRLAVRRNHGIALGSGVGGQPVSATALYADRPEVPLGGEDDRIAVDGGRRVVASMQWRWGLRGSQIRDQEVNQSETGQLATTVAGQHERILLFTNESPKSQGCAASLRFRGSAAVSRGRSHS